MDGHIGQDSQDGDPLVRLVSVVHHHGLLYSSFFQNSKVSVINAMEGIELSGQLKRLELKQANMFSDSFKNSWKFEQN